MQSPSSVHHPDTSSRPWRYKKKTSRSGWRRLAMIILVSTGLMLLWLGACLWEWRTGRRVLPWDAYGGCGTSAPAALPATVRVGVYEEFPNPWRLARLNQVDFPVTLAIAAPSRAAFLSLRED